jgi:arginyl-tRNA synthetase
MKRQLEGLLRRALRTAVAAGDLNVEVPDRIALEEPADPSFGDAAANVAMVLAKQAGRSPRSIAQAIVAHLDDPREALP